MAYFMEHVVTMFMMLLGLRKKQDCKVSQIVGFSIETRESRPQILAGLLSGEM